MTVSRRLPGSLLPFIMLFLMIAGVYMKAWDAALNAPWSIIRDDGRHFVTWLRMLADPALFPNDPIADYFRNLTPALFEALHRPAVWFDIDVVAWNILIVTPVILALGVYSANRLLGHYFHDPLQRGAVLALVLFLIFGELAQGLPRSFAYPIFFGALIAYIERCKTALAVILLLGSSLYATAAIVSVGAIGMAGILNWIAARRFSASEPFLTGVAIFSCLAGLTFFLVGANSAGTTITLSEARDIPIFQPGGRTAFFTEDTASFWLCRPRSGFLGECFELQPFAALGLYVATFLVGGFALSRASIETRTLRLTLAIFLAAAALYALTLLIAFHAHLPQRYTKLPLTFLFPLTLGAIAVWPSQISSTIVRRSGQGICVLLLLAFISPTLSYGAGDFHKDKYPSLSARLRDMPHDNIVASINRQGDSVPTYTGLSIYLSRELTVPYKKEYLALMEARAGVQDRLFRGPLDDEWGALLEKSGIDVFLLGDNDTNAWARLSRSFSSIQTPPERTVFEVAARVTASCVIASALHGKDEKKQKLRAVDAKCFAEGVR